VSDLPDLPDGDAPPPAALAERLASLLPAEDRDAGHALLSDRILPSAFAGLEDHPRPRKVAELIYEELASGSWPPSSRIASARSKRPPTRGRSGRWRRTRRRSPWLAT
jgi:hypothetical protein